MTSTATAIVRFLRSGGVRRASADSLGPVATLLVLVLSSGTYGAVMASFGGLGGARTWMVLYGALKVPLLFLVTLALAIPSFYMANLLLGVGDDFRRVWRGLVDYQLSVGLQLLALVPATILVNLTTDDYRLAQTFSTLMFAGAAWNARVSLNVVYRELATRHPVHHPLQRLWFGLYTFIGVQMGWDLRPFVGNPSLEVQFFRAEIGNAYVEVARVLGEAVGLL